MTTHQPDIGRPASKSVLVLGLLAGLAPSATAQQPAFGVEHVRFPAPDLTGWAWSAYSEVGPNGPVLFLAAVGIDSGVAAVGAVVGVPGAMPDPILGAGVDFGNFPPTISTLTGDFDGDAVPDFYLWDAGFTSDGMLKVVPFDGASFGAPVELGFSIEDGPGRARSFVDFDGDARADVVFKQSDTQLGVAWSTRPGQSPEVIDLGFSFEIESFEDLDADGLPDVLVRRSGLALCQILPGTGGDQFGPARTVSLPANDPTAGVLDLTGDGQPDIVLGSATSMTVLINDAGAFSPMIIPIAEGVAAVRPVGDFDDDGMPDVIVTTRLTPQAAGELDWVWRNPILGYDRDALWLVEGRTGASVVHDADGDGLEDLVTLDVAVTIDHRSVTPGRDRLGGQAREIRRNPRHVEAADLDADGVPELIVTGESSPRVYQRDASGTYAETTLQGGQAFMSAVTDIDADGLPDLVISTGSDTVDINRGLPDGHFGLVERLPLPAGAQTAQLAIADLNDDGLADFAVADYGLGRVHIFHAQPGTLPLLVQSVPASGAFGLCVLPNPAGSSIIATSDWTGGSIHLLTREDGVWSVDAERVLPHNPYWLTADDVDADGHTDIAFGTRGQRFGFLYGSAGGIADEGSYLPFRIGSGFPGSAGPLEHQAVDLTGNGLLDLVVVSSSSADGASIYLQTAPREFTRGGSAPGTPATGLAVTDLDNDGALDLATVSDAFFRGMLYTTYGIADTCPPDLDANGTLNFFDLSAYLALYSAQDPRADLAAPQGVFNFFDVSAYLASYNAGCP